MKNVGGNFVERAEEAAGEKFLVGIRGSNKAKGAGLASDAVSWKSRVLQQEEEQRVVEIVGGRITC